MTKKIPKKIRDAAETMTLPEAAQRVKEGEAISRLAWKGKTIVKKSTNYKHAMTRIDGCCVEKYAPSIDDCLATDWFVVEEEKKGKG